MIDINLVRERYAGMTTDQLIHLTRTDSQDLTTDALLLLRQEFEQRGLSIDSFLPDAQKQSPEEEQDEPIPGIYNPATNTDNAVLGLNYYSVPNPAREKAMKENKKRFLASLTEENLKTLIKKCDNSMLLYSVVFIAGFAVTAITFFNAAEEGGSYLVAWGAILFGAYRFFETYAAKTKYQSLLKNIQQKKENEPTTDQ